MLDLETIGFVAGGYLVYLATITIYAEVCSYLRWRSARQNLHTLLEVSKETRQWMTYLCPQQPQPFHLNIDSNNEVHSSNDLRTTIDYQNSRPSRHTCPTPTSSLSTVFDVLQMFGQIVGYRQIFTEVITSLLPIFINFFSTTRLPRSSCQRNITPLYSPSIPTPMFSIPTNPTPVNPIPINPIPENLIPENLIPENPTPENPIPENPTPAIPTLESPTPVIPIPESPTPVIPIPENPTPINSTSNVPSKIRMQPAYTD